MALRTCKFRAPTARGHNCACEPADPWHYRPPAKAAHSNLLIPCHAHHAHSVLVQTCLFRVLAATRIPAGSDMCSPSLSSLTQNGRRANRDFWVSASCHKQKGRNRPEQVKHPTPPNGQSCKAALPETPKTTERWFEPSMATGWRSTVSDGML